MRGGSRGKAAVPTPAPVTSTVRPPSGAWGQHARGRGVGSGQNIETASVVPLSAVATEDGIASVGTVSSATVDEGKLCNGAANSYSSVSVAPCAEIETKDSELPDDKESELSDKATELSDDRLFEEVQGLFTGIAKNERHIWRDLLQLVSDEAKSGSVRTRWSILNTIAGMSESNLNNLIEVYEEAISSKRTAVEEDVVPEKAPVGQTASIEVSTNSEDRDAPPPGLGLPSNPAVIPPGLGPPPAKPPPQLPPPPTVAPVAPPPSSAPPEPAPHETKQVALDVPSTDSATSPEISTDEQAQPSNVSAPAVAQPPRPKAPVDEQAQPTNVSAPAVAQPPRPKAPVKRISYDWLQKRVFELRVPMSDLGLGVQDLLSVLQGLDNTQPLLPQVKMWIGLEEKEDMNPALSRLVEEFAALKKASS